MTKLDLAHNELTGTIPAKLLRAFGSHLVKFYLIDKNLVGPIPTEVGKLKKMEELTFAQNYLSGMHTRAAAEYIVAFRSLMIDWLFNFN